MNRSTWPRSRQLLAVAAGTMFVLVGASACRPPKSPDNIPGSYNQALMPDPRDGCFTGQYDHQITDGGVPSPKPRGSLDKEEIRTEIRSHLADVKACYDAGLAKHPGRRGRVEVTFVISPSGKVSSSGIGHTTMNDVEIETCVGRLSCRWQFPKPNGGGIVIVTYPFNFTP